ncbi:hypothetical protein BJV74DRAFT_864960, partial [Russula compacta]
MTSQLDQTPRLLDKGKAREISAVNNQEPSENSPLLGSRSYPILPDDDNLETDSQLFSHGISLLSKLTTVFLITLAISILLILLLVSLAYSYAAKASQHLSNDDILTSGFVLRGPDAVDVLNISHRGDIWLRLDGHIGFDAGYIIGVKPAHDDNLWLSAWKAIGRWGIDDLDTITLNLSSIDITSQYDSSVRLASIQVPPFQIPLTANPPDDTSWLVPISLPVHIDPSHDVSAWLKFVQESWKSGYAIVQATVSRVGIQWGSPPGSTWTWRSLLSINMSPRNFGLHIKIPTLPALPTPGNSQSLPSIFDLVQLTHFSLSSSSHTHNLIIDATASVVNPAPSTITFTSPPLPFVVWIPPWLNTTNHSLVPLASVTAEPFTLTHPNITLSLYGNVLPISPSAVPALSSLVSDYLSGIDHPISITSSFALFANYSAHTKFPAPHPRPEVLRNVTIEGMKIHASGTTILASGTLHARIALPAGMDVTLLIDRILPDVLVFDGPLPTISLPASSPFTSTTTPTATTTESMTKHNGDDDDVPPAPPLPSPLPPRAFARVRPSTWLTASSKPTAPRPDWGERERGTTLRISAWFADVPLEVLPGREHEFRSFVAKVIFGRSSEGAVAGVQGVTAVGVRIEGLHIGQSSETAGDSDGGGSGMVLTGLPFQGSIRVGRSGLRL